eukprot:360874-Chlamydomonas_euryale.AAC.29
MHGHSEQRRLQHAAVMRARVSVTEWDVAQLGIVRSCKLGTLGIILTMWVSREMAISLGIHGFLNVRALAPFRQFQDITSMRMQMYADEKGPAAHAPTLHVCRCLQGWLAGMLENFGILASV